MTYKLFALFFTLVLSACGTTAVTAPDGRSHAPARSVSSRILLPEQIRLEGKIYRAKYQNHDATTTEYYLQGEQGYQWSNLLTIIHAKNVGLDEFGHRLARQHAIEALPLSHIQRAGNRLLMRSMYRPVPGDARFASYETNLAVIKHESCGAIALQYAQRHPASSNPTRLAAALARKHKAFAREAETILKQLQCQ